MASHGAIFPQVERRTPNFISVVIRAGVRSTARISWARRLDETCLTPTDRPKQSTKRRISRGPPQPWEKKSH
jgi:hypothetical protein